MATELAQAYVQIVPSAKGISGSITSVLDGESASAGKSAGQNIGGSLVSTLKNVIIAAGIGEMISQTLSAGAELQQSIGGIETLFGAGGQSVEQYAESVGKSVAEVQDEYDSLMQAQTTVLENADQAYKTAGLSANDYMQQVTSFSASLLQSLDGDTNAAAAAADQAVIDMADNVNKMGSSMESIQDAYQGFAKQNYTMLDNLKLGYGGTKTEMERLLADASELAGVEYNIDNLADVYEAIHVIQEEMGITGTTAKEAASTFSGSFSAMKSSLDNFMANLALGNDLGPSIQALVETASTFFFNNFVPMLMNIVSAIPSAIGTIITTAAPILLEQLSGIINSIIEFISGDGFNNLLTSMQTSLANILNILTERGPEFLNQGVMIVTNLVNGIVQSLPSVITTVGSMVQSMLDYILSNLPMFIESGVNMIVSIVQGIINSLPDIVNSVIEVIKSFLQTIVDNLPQIIQSGIEMIFSLISGLVEAIPDLLASAGEIVSQLIDAFLSVDWLGVGLDIIGGIGQGIINGVGGLIQSGIDAVGNLASSIGNALGIGSPSKVMADEVGRWIPAGISKGIMDNQATALNAMEYVGNGITTTAKDLSFDFSDPTGVNLELIAQAVKEGAEAANLNAYFDTNKVADSTTSRMDRNLSLSAASKMRYSQ